MAGTSKERAGRFVRPKNDRAGKMARVQWAIGAGVTLLVLAAWLAGWTGRLEYPADDEFASRFHAHSPPASNKLCMVVIDDGSLENVRDWPWPRDMQARVIDELGRAGAKVIALDLLLNVRGEPHPADDGSQAMVDPDPALARSLLANGTVVLGTKFPGPPPPGSAPYETRKLPFAEVFDLVKENPSRDKNELLEKLAAADSKARLAADLQAQIGAVRDDVMDKVAWSQLLIKRAGVFSLPVRSGGQSAGGRGRPWSRSVAPEPPRPELLAACARIGSVSAEGIADADKVVRRMPLWVRHDDRLYPTLGLAAASEFLGVSVDQLRIEGDQTIIPRPGPAGGDIRLEMHTAELSGVERDGLIYLAWPNTAGWYWSPEAFVRRGFRAPPARPAATPADNHAPVSDCGDLSFPLDPNLPLHIGAVYEPQVQQERLKRNLRDIDLAILKLSDPKYHGQGAVLGEEELKSFQAGSELLQRLDIADPRWAGEFERHMKQWHEVKDNAEFFAGGPAQAEPPAANGAENAPAQETDTAQDAAEILKQSRLVVERLPPAENQVRCALQRIASVRSALRARVEGKLCLVGWVATGSIADFVPTSIAGLTPGAYLHAAVINSILTGFQKHVSAPWVGAASVVSLVALGLAGTAIGLYLSVGFSPLALAGAIGAWLLFAGIVEWDLRNMVAAFATPALACAGSWLGVILHRLLVEQRGRKQTEARFRSYVSPDVVDILVNNPDLQSMVPQSKELTIMFSDVANWTTLTERLGTGGIYTFLSTYLKAMTDILQSNRATLDKYLGDGIMAFWGAPIDDPDHARNAAKACVEMMDKLAEMNRTGGFGDAGTVEVRFGLAAGEVNVGDFGNPPSKSAYTVIGDAVNLAARLESSNKQFGSSILMTRRVLDLSGSTLRFRPIGRIVVKGKTEYEEIYELIGDRNPKGDRTAAWIEQTVRAVGAYTRGDLDGAEVEFRVLKEEFDDKKLAEIYLGSIEHLRREGIPPGFDGELVLTEK